MIRQQMCNEVCETVFDLSFRSAHPPQSILKCGVQRALFEELFFSITNGAAGSLLVDVVEINRVLLSDVAEEIGKSDFSLLSLLKYFVRAGSVGTVATDATCDFCLRCKSLSGPGVAVTCCISFHLLYSEAKRSEAKKSEY